MKCDVIIIGGGTSGCGVALEAARCGLSVQLIERERCLSKTSANSLRIIHGGLRYVQSFNFSRAISSRADQTRLLKELAHIVKPLPCLMPLSARGIRSRFPMRLALCLDRILSIISASPLPQARVLSPAEIQATVPLLRQSAPYGAFLWHDALICHFEGFVEALRQQMTRSGVELREQAEVKSIEKRGDTFALLVRSLAGQEVIESRAVVNTAGPWLPNIRCTGLGTPASDISWCKAFNIILSRQLEAKYAVAVYGVEGRLYLAVPRGNITVLGTWYVKHEGGLDDVQVSNAEIDEALCRFNTSLAEAHVSRADIGAVEAGLLPATMRPDGNFDLLGEEQIFSERGCVNVVSTKLTTFHSQARKVLKEVLPFIGGDKYAGNC